MKPRTKIDLKELQAANLPRLKWQDLFKITGDLSEEHEKQLTDYFSHFVALVDNKCPGCGSVLARGSQLDSILIGASFEWGLANGEGHCSECGYPARAYHRNVGPIAFVNLILPYHPADLSVKDA